MPRAKIQTHNHHSWRRLFLLRAILASCLLAAIPAHAQSGAYVFDEVADGVFVHIGAVALPDAVNQGDVSNTGFIIGEEAVLVIDSGGSASTGQAIISAIRAQTDLPIQYLALTHMHPDHIYGAKTLADAGAQLIGHANLAEAIATREASYAQNYAHLIGDEAEINADIPPIAENVEEGGQSLDLGGREIRLLPEPLAHTNNDLIVFDPQTGVMFLGDLLFEDHVPVIDGSVRGWQNVLDNLQNTEEFAQARIIIPGHGQILRTDPSASAIFAMERAYFDALIKDAQQAVADGTRMGDAIKTIGQSQRENWSLFEDYNARNASVVYSEIEWE